MLRYVRLLLALARFSLLREMSFRGNFLAKVTVEMLWLFILLAFYRVIFGRTNSIATWTEGEYLFFLGCSYALSGLIETLFLENCSEFAELVRSGDLDFALLKPIDEQFLLSCRNIDWSTIPNVLVGFSLMGVSLWQFEQPIEPWRFFAFPVMLLCGLAIAYSFLLMLTSTSVWMVRNQSLYELWWLAGSLMRYPTDIFERSWAWWIGRIFTFAVPIMLVINVPAATVVKALDPRMVAFTAVVSVLLLIVSRAVFRTALRRYRSASS